MEYQDLILEQQDGVSLVTLNRPQVLNALRARTVHELIDVVEQADRDEATKVLVFTGAGRAFCSGADLSPSAQEEAAELDEAAGYRRITQGAIGRWGILFGQLGHFRKPVIAAVNGVASGGGFSLALAADIRIASTQASFISVFMRRGLVPDTGASFHLPQLIGVSRSLEMMLTGDAVSADQAERWGLVNRVVPPEQLMPEALELAHRLASGPSVTIELTKRLVHDLTREGLVRQLQNEAWAASVISRTEDVAEGRRAFFEKRQPMWKGR